MRTYQKHPVTVESQAIAVTAAFVIDVHTSFVELDNYVSTLLQREQAEYVYDGSSFFRVDPNDYTSIEGEMIIRAWNLTHRILKTVHPNAHSEVYSQWQKYVKEQEEEMTDEPAPEAPARPAI